MALVTQQESYANPDFQKQFDAPGAVIANVIGHVIAVAPPASAETVARTLPAAIRRPA